MDVVAVVARPYMYGEKEGDFPLYLVAHKDQLETNKVLLEHEAEVNQANKYVFSPLWIAAWNNPFEAVNFLLAHGANINQSWQSKNVPKIPLMLMIAKQKDHPAIVTLLQQAEQGQRPPETPVCFQSNAGSDTSIDEWSLPIVEGECMHKSISETKTRQQEEKVERTPIRFGWRREEFELALALNPLFKDSLIHYQVGEAFNTGDCFFDALAQGLMACGIKKITVAGKCTELSVSSLRGLCQEHLLFLGKSSDQQHQICFNAFKKAIEDDAKVAGYKGFEDYLEKIARPAKAIDAVNGINPPIWGRLGIEGELILSALRAQSIKGIQINLYTTTTKEISKSFELFYSQQPPQNLIKQGDFKLEIIEGRLATPKEREKVRALEGYHIIQLNDNRYQLGFCDINGDYKTYEVPHACVKWGGALDGWRNPELDEGDKQFPLYKLYRYREDEPKELDELVEDKSFEVNDKKDNDNWRLYFWKNKKSGHIKIEISEVKDLNALLGQKEQNICKNECGVIALATEVKNKIKKHGLYGDISYTLAGDKESEEKVKSFFVNKLSGILPPEGLARVVFSPEEKKTDDRYQIHCWLSKSRQCYKQLVNLPEKNPFLERLSLVSKQQADEGSRFCLLNDKEISKLISVTYCDVISEDSKKAVKDKKIVNLLLARNHFIPMFESNNSEAACLQKNIEKLARHDERQTLRKKQIQENPKMEQQSTVKEEVKIKTNVKQEKKDEKNIKELTDKRVKNGVLSIEGVKLTLEEYQQALDAECQHYAEIQQRINPSFEEEKKIANKKIKKSKQWISEHFEKIECGAGGDCLFKSLAKGLNSIAHMDLRKRVVAVLRRDENKFKSVIEAEGNDIMLRTKANPMPTKIDNFKDYCNKMEKSGTWGGEIEIAIASKIIRRPITLISLEIFNGKERKYFPGGNDNGTQSVFLYYSGDHYQYLKPKGIDCHKKQQVLPVLSISQSPVKQKSQQTQNNSIKEKQQKFPNEINKILKDIKDYKEGERIEKAFYFLLGKKEESALRWMQKLFSLAESHNINIDVNYMFTRRGDKKKFTLLNKAKKLGKHQLVELLIKHSGNSKLGNRINLSSKTNGLLELKSSFKNKEDLKGFFERSIKEMFPDIKKYQSKKSHSIFISYSWGKNEKEIKEKFSSAIIEKQAKNHRKKVKEFHQLLSSTGLKVLRDYDNAVFVEEFTKKAKDSIVLLIGEPTLKMKGERGCFRLIANGPHQLKIIEKDLSEHLDLLIYKKKEEGYQICFYNIEIGSIQKKKLIINEELNKIKEKIDKIHDQLTNKNLDEIIIQDEGGEIREVICNAHEPFGSSMGAYPHYVAKELNYMLQRAVNEDPNNEWLIPICFADRDCFPDHIAGKKLFSNLGEKKFSTLTQVLQYHFEKEINYKVFFDILRRIIEQIIKEKDKKREYINTIDEREKRFMPHYKNYIKCLLIKELKESYQKSKNALPFSESFLSYDRIMPFCLEIDSSSSSRKSKNKVMLESLWNNQHLKRQVISASSVAGKTTLCHYVKYLWAKGEIWQNKFDLVIYIPLVRFQDNLEKYKLTDFELADFIYALIKNELQSNFDLSVGVLKNLINKEKILYLLDGYDEVLDIHSRYWAKNKNDPSCISAKERFLNSLFDLENFILTVRKGIDTNYIVDRNGKALRKLEISPFTAKEIASYNVAFYNEAIVDKKTQIPRPRILELARYPLLLEMMISNFEYQNKVKKGQNKVKKARNKSRNKKSQKINIFFNDQHDIYFDFINLSFNTFKNGFLKSKQKWICNLAWQITKEDKNIFSIEDLEKVNPIKLDNVDLNKLVDCLKKTNFVKIVHEETIVPSRNTYSFIHNNLQYYLAALYVCDNWSKIIEKEFAELFSRPCLRKVWPLAISGQKKIESNENDKYKLISKILSGYINKSGINNKLTIPIGDFPFLLECIEASDCKTAPDENYAEEKVIKIVFEEIINILKKLYKHKTYFLHVWEGVCKICPKALEMGYFDGFIQQVKNEEKGNNEKKEERKDLVQYIDFIGSAYDAQPQSEKLEQCLIDIYNQDFKKLEDIKDILNNLEQAREYFSDSVKQNSNFFSKYSYDVELIQKLKKLVEDEKDPFQFFSQDPRVQLKYRNLNLFISHNFKKQPKKIEQIVEKFYKSQRFFLTAWKQTCNLFSEVKEEDDFNADFLNQVNKMERNPPNPPYCDEGKFIEQIKKLEKYLLKISSQGINELVGVLSYFGLQALRSNKSTINQLSSLMKKGKISKITILKLFADSLNRYLKKGEDSILEHPIFEEFKKLDKKDKKFIINEMNKDYSSKKLLMCNIRNFQRYEKEKKDNKKALDETEYAEIKEIPKELISKTEEDNSKNLFLTKKDFDSLLHSLFNEENENFRKLFDLSEYPLISLSLGESDDMIEDFYMAKRSFELFLFYLKNDYNYQIFKSDKILQFKNKQGDNIFSERQAKSLKKWLNQVLKSYKVSAKFNESSQAEFSKKLSIIISQIERCYSIAYQGNKKFVSGEVKNKIIEELLKIITDKKEEKKKIMLYKKMMKNCFLEEKKDLEEKQKKSESELGYLSTIEELGYELVFFSSDFFENCTIEEFDKLLAGDFPYNQVIRLIDSSNIPIQQEFFDKFIELIDKYDINSARSRNKTQQEENYNYIYNINTGDEIKYLINHFPSNFFFTHLIKKLQDNQQKDLGRVVKYWLRSVLFSSTRLVYNICGNEIKLKLFSQAADELVQAKIKQESLKRLERTIKNLFGDTIILNKDSDLSEKNRQKKKKKKKNNRKNKLETKNENTATVSSQKTVKTRQPKNINDLSNDLIKLSNSQKTKEQHQPEEIIISNKKQSDNHQQIEDQQENGKSKSTFFRLNSSSCKKKLTNKKVNNKKEEKKEMKKVNQAVKAEEKISFANPTLFHHRQQRDNETFPSSFSLKPNEKEDCRHPKLEKITKEQELKIILTVANEELSLQTKIKFSLDLIKDLCSAFKELVSENVVNFPSFTFDPTFNQSLPSVIICVKDKDNLNEINNLLDKLLKADIDKKKLIEKRL